MDMVGDNVSALSGMDQKIVVSNMQINEHTWELAKFVISTDNPTLPPDLFAVPKWRKEQIAESWKVTQKYSSDRSAPLLSQIANELPLEMNENQLGYLLSGASPTKTHVAIGRMDMAFPNDGGAWRLIKHGNKVYLRGWIASDQEVNGPFLHLYNFSSAKELGISPRQITICFDNFHFGPYGEIYSQPIEGWTKNISAIDPAGHRYAGPFCQQLILSDVHLDKHAWEKWSP